MTALSVLWGCTDMFISKTRYQALQEIIADQNQTIQSLNSYIALLKKENLVYQQLFNSSDTSDLDFPNSQKGGFFEGSNIFDL